MNFLLTTFILLGLGSYSKAYILSPDVFKPQNANKNICQYFETDKSNSGNSYGPPVPYMMCPVHSTIKIVKARLVLTTPKMCPLQYTYQNEVVMCPTGDLMNDDPTPELKSLCDVKQKCFFTWNAFKQLQCIDYDSLIDIDYNNQALNVTYKCITKKQFFRPFPNRRYNSKFHRTFNHPIRHLSYNRFRFLPPVPPTPMRVSMPISIKTPPPAPYKAPYPAPKYGSKMPYPAPVPKYAPPMRLPPAPAPYAEHKYGPKMPYATPKYEQKYGQKLPMPAPAAY